MVLRGETAASGRKRSQVRMSSIFQYLFPLFLLYGLLLYGLVYLFVESELFERPRKFFTKAVESPEDAAIETLLHEPAATNVIAVPSAPKQSFGQKLRRFVGKVLSCAMCSSGWLSVPTTILVCGIVLSCYYQIWWLLGVCAFFTIPPASIGFVAILDLFSPNRVSV